MGGHGNVSEEGGGARGKWGGERSRGNVSEGLGRGTLLAGTFRRDWGGGGARSKRGHDNMQNSWMVLPHFFRELPGNLHESGKERTHFDLLSI